MKECERVHNRAEEIPFINNDNDNDNDIVWSLLITDDHQLTETHARMPNSFSNSFLQPNNTNKTITVNIAN